MTGFRPPTPAQAELLDALTRAGLLIPTGAPGVYGRGAAFEEVRLRFAELVGRAGPADGAERAERVHFPPVLPRRQLETMGYLDAFPHQLGTIYAFEGDERDASEQAERAARHDEWGRFQRMTELALAPAACYPVYPAVAARGPLPEGGATVDTGSAYVFRREPSGDPARLQSFHMRELVRLAAPDAVSAWLGPWRDRALRLFRELGLDADAEPAADPFFGRTGRLLAASQREQGLKWEIRAEVVAGEPAPIASVNHHRDHFASLFGLRTADGGPAHTACVGFGEERIVLALFRRHGLDLAAWPSGVRELLWPQRR